MNTILFSIRMPEVLKEDIEKEAKKEELPPSTYARSLLKFALDYKTKDSLFDSQVALSARLDEKDYRREKIYQAQAEQVASLEDHVDLLNEQNEILKRMVSTQDEQKEILNKRIEELIGQNAVLKIRIEEVEKKVSSQKKKSKTPVMGKEGKA